MRATGSRAFAVFTFLSVLALAAGAATLQDFVSPYLYPGENYTADANVTQLDLLGGNYLLVQMRGADAFLVNRTGNGTALNYSFVMDAGAAFSILRTEGVASTYPTASEISELQQLVRAYDSSRHPREEECLQQVGMDRPGATCEPGRCEACMGVPVCMANLPYNGRDFEISIHDYGASHFAMSGAVTNATNAIALMNSSPDVAPHLDVLVDSLTSAGTHQVELLNNHLFGCFELTAGGQMPPTGLDWCAYRSGTDAGKWCFPIIFNSSALNSALTKANQLRNRIVTNASLTVRANSFVSTMQTRMNDRVIRQQNASFQAFFSQLQSRSDNLTSAANAVLSHVEYPELQADAATLTGVLTNISRYGAARNYTAANSTATLFYVLAGKVDAETRNITARYNTVIAANESASLSLFEAQLLIEPSDGQLATELSSYALQKDIIDDKLEGRMTQSQMNDTLSDLRFVGLKMDALTATKRSRLSMQGVTWIGSLASGISGAVIGVVSTVIPISQADKENYARTLPTVLTLIAGTAFYLACVAVFALLVLTRRLRLHKVAVVLWVAIFAFLFIMVALVTITAHSLVQKQASRSAYDLFSSGLAGSPSATIVVVRDNTTAGGLNIMRGCGESLRRSLAAKGKSVTVYEYAGSGCIPVNGTSMPVSECDALSGNAPQFTLYHGNGTQMTFYAYYAHSALLTGNDDFYSRCYIAKVLNGTA